MMQKFTRFMHRTASMGCEEEAGLEYDYLMPSDEQQKKTDAVIENAYPLSSGAVSSLPSDEQRGKTGAVSDPLPSDEQRRKAGAVSGALPSETELAGVPREDQAKKTGLVSDSSASSEQRRQTRA